MGYTIFQTGKDEAVLKSVLQAISRQSLPEDLPHATERQDKWNLPGFGPKTRITTSFGDLPIEALRLRDDIRTSTGKMLRVQWIDQIRVDQGYLRAHPEAQPVIIRRDALGHGKPSRDLLLSPRQGLGLTASQSRFTIAEEIKDRPNVSSSPQNSFTYFLFHCGEPATVFAEGVQVPVAPLPKPPNE